MSMQEFIDILHELIAVDTDNGLVTYTYLEGNIIKVKLCDNTQFIVTVEKTKFP